MSSITAAERLGTGRRKANRAMPSPNFFIIGAAKCGTTSLAAMLERHPDVFLPSEPKELYFFSDDHRYNELGWDWYLEHFRQGMGCSCIGEADPDYSASGRFPRCAERIACDVPDAKIIYIVRHPLRRLESHWRQLQFNGVNPPPFDEALRTWPEIVDSSLYMKQLDCYRKHFSAEQILVLFSDELKARPEVVLERLLDFLGLSTSYVPKPIKQKLNGYDMVRVDGPALRVLRRAPGFNQFYELLKHAFPEPARAMFRRTFRKPMLRGKWTPELIEWAYQAIEQDSRKFLRYAGKPDDYWNLRDVAPPRV